MMVFYKKKTSFFTAQVFKDAFLFSCQTFKVNLNVSYLLFFLIRKTKWTSGRLLHVAKTDEGIDLLQNVIIKCCWPLLQWVREGLMHLHPHPGLNTPATSCRPIYFDHNVNTPAPTTCQAPNQAQLLNPEPFLSHWTVFNEACGCYDIFFLIQRGKLSATQNNLKLLENSKHCSPLTPHGSAGMSIKDGTSLIKYFILTLNES